ncbi:hypothetical protein J3A83DRAFT_4208329 [Scleroderma citrinum]
MAPALKPLLIMSQNPQQSSQIITGDTSLPPALIAEATWDLQQSPYSASSMDTTDWGYYTMPLSPPTSLSSNISDSPEPPAKKLRLSASPELLENNHQCIPTQKVFDLPEAPFPSSTSIGQPPSNNPLLAKKFFASTNASAKRTRGSGERISTKDFARLVKNRAAAFLSRQRKREEFEAMEVRVRQLEEENARLQHLTEKGSQHDELRSEIDHLRMQLQAAEKRELNLSMEIARHSTPLSVKAETSTDCLSSVHDAQNTPMTLGHVRHILLRALPSLLSMSPKSSLPISVTLPLSEPRVGDQQLSAFNPLSPDIDGGVKTMNPYSSADCPPIDPESLHELDNVVISFETAADESLIRVRIDPSRPVNKVHCNPPLQPKVGDKPRSSSLGTWSGSGVSSYVQPFALQPMESPPPSLSVDTPSPAATINQFCAFLTSGTPRTSPDYHAVMMPYMQPSFNNVTDQQPFELFSNSLDHIMEDKAKYQGRTFHPHLGGEGNWQVSVC